MNTEGKKIHVAMLIGALTKGGAERVMVNLADDFMPEDFIQTVAEYDRLCCSTHPN